MIAPTSRSRFGQPSSRRPMPAANELSTVEWQSAQVIPTRVRVWLASTSPTTPNTAPSSRSATVVAGSSRSTVPAARASRNAAGSASTSTLRPTESAVAGLTPGPTVPRITSCIRRVSDQKVSSPNASSLKILLPRSTSRGLKGPCARSADEGDGGVVGWSSCSHAATNAARESPARIGSVEATLRLNDARCLPTPKIEATILRLISTSSFFRGRGHGSTGKDSSPRQAPGLGSANCQYGEG